MEIRSVASFLQYYGGIRGRTQRVVELIPDDRFEWRYSEERFSLGDLVRHLAALERYMFAETVAGRQSTYPGHGRELADGAVAVRAYLREKHEESVEIFRSLSDEDLDDSCVTPAGARITRWKWLRAMVEHEVHHRGQIYLMLGMTGVPTPPLFGLTSEQVRERSTGETVMAAESHGSRPRRGPGEDP